MKRLVRIIGSSILAASLAGGAAASAAGLSAQASLTGDGKWMTELSTFAGTGDLDDKDASLLEASFRVPESIAVGADGAIWVSDTRNQVIRKLSEGKTTVYAGVNLLLNEKGFPEGGWADGALNASFFQRPTGITADGKGNLYTADAGNHVIRKIGADGQVTTVAGDGVLGHKDGKGKGARFYNPKDVAVAKDGTLYVADTLNHLIRKISTDGKVITLNARSARAVEVSPGKAVWAGDYADGDLSSAKFNEPSGLSLDAKGNLFVSDTGNHRIRYIDFAAGRVSTVAGGGLTEDGKVYPAKELYAEGDFADGAAADARFHFPAGIAVTEEGGLLIADSMNHSVRYLLNGQVVTISGAADQSAGETDGIEGFGQLHAPSDVAELPGGQVLVSDSYNNKIRLIGLWKLPDALTNDGTVHVVLNGKEIGFDAAPEISPEGRTMVPVRAIAEAIGYEVSYTEIGQIVGLSNGSNRVEMSIGGFSVKRSAAGKPAVEQKTDAAPFIKSDRTYVPLRFFAENMDMDVQWDAATRTAILRTKVAAK